MALHAQRKYRQPSFTDKGHFSWFNEINGAFQACSEDFGCIEIAWMYPGVATQSTLIKKAYPVGLDCGGAVSPLIGDWNWANDNAIPFVDYCIADERHKFFGLLLETMPPPDQQNGQPPNAANGFLSKQLVRVLLQGFLLPYQHGFTHMTPAYLPTVRGNPLTTVANGTHVGYFVVGDNASGINNSGIYLNPMPVAP